MIIAQTNDGSNTANSYVTTADLSAYATNRGIVLKSTDLESLLFQAMDTIESKQYKSEIVKPDQSTEFPRMGVGIPRAIKTAQIMLAISQDSAIPVTDTPVAAIKSEQVAEIKVEYFENGNTKSALLDMVDSLLKPYMVGGAAINFVVRRG